ncbi:MAG TPA: alpha/beta fold hydrolase [Candidatus Aminicenantes bacterium]|nr:alpha/beta fold hydrolase [Candidatus Aminicenantes bacterium]HRY64014.1 alpha/beta fold hydrolase [Candidatus Aminicenantes bacterium]HRZ70927.1 alpha/beta fold hydrolase [Candidatus Aminicenantes bacterium]
MHKDPLMPGLGILAVAAAIGLGSAPAPSADAPAVIEKMVNVGPIDLFFRIYAGGAPTVLLESGGGLDSGEWTTFGPCLAKATASTVVTYDRAGFGRSGLPDTPYDLAQETGWLWAALEKLGLDKNIILAGHSYGGLLLRHEAATRPGAVRGLVFIDPFTVEFVDLMGIDYCNGREGLGKLPRLSPEQYAGLSKQDRADLRMAGYPGGNLAAKCDLLRPLAYPQDIPVRIITSGRTWMRENEMPAWRQAHQRLAASIAGAKLVVASESDHMIHERQPDLVIKAVAEVIAESRTPR